jgi:spore coat protein SA
VKLCFVSGWGQTIPPVGFGPVEGISWEVSTRLANHFQVGIISKSPGSIEESFKNITCYYMNNLLSIVDSQFPKKQIYKRFVLDSLDRERPDAIITDNPFFVELLDIPNSKIIYHAHSVDINMSTLQEYWKIRVSRMFKECHRILCVSNYVKKSLCPFAEDNSKFKVILNGVDTSRFRPSEKDNIVLCTSRIDPIKGQKYLLKAFSELKTDWKLSFTGLSPKIYNKKYYEECCKYEMGNMVPMGLVFGKELQRLYARAKIFVCPSVCQDAFPLVNLEAMSSGCAIIATNVGGIPEQIQHKRNGFLVPPRNSDAIREMLTVLMDNESLLQEIATQARIDAVRKFDWDVIIKDYIKFFDSLEANC